MNIAIFASAFYPHFGGVEEACRNLALEYNKRGHKAIILTNRHPKTLPAHETFQGIEVHRFSFTMPNSRPQGMLNFARQFPKVMREVTTVLRENKIDRIHVQCVSSNGLYALFAAKRMRLPLIVTTQGERTMDAGKLYEKSATANWTLKNLLRKADYVTACSEQTLEDARQYLGDPLAGKSRPVYNGISLAEFEADTPAYVHARPYLLAIGRVVPQKGFDILLDAYAKVLSQNADAPDLLIAGDGPERENLQNQIETLGLAGRAHLVGFADRPKAVSLFKGCEAFILPSRHEPQGIVSLEAMVCGKPVVAARVGGVPEIVLDGETGLLFTGSDAESLAAALQKLLACPECAARYGQAGRERVIAEFTWPRIADQYFEIYQRD